MNKFDHIIWDWNGTIIDDAWLCVEIMNEVLSEKNLELININSYRQNFCFPVKEYYKKLGFDFEKEEFEISGLLFIKKYLKRMYEPILYPEFINVIELLSNKGVSHSILSAQDSKTLNVATKYYKVNKYFENIFGINNQYAYGKLEEGIVLLEQIKYEKNRILIIGDTKHDAEIASKLGIHCLLLSCGHNNKSQLSKTDYKIINCHKKIINYVLL